LSSAPSWSAGANDQLTNAALAARFGAADEQRDKESPGRAGAFKEISMKRLEIKVP